MSDWKFIHIIEISIVIFSFLLPIFIFILIFYLIGVLFKELIKIVYHTGTGNIVLILFSIVAIGLLSYAEFRLLKWIKA